MIIFKNKNIKLCLVLKRLSSIKNKKIKLVLSFFSQENNEN